MTPGWPHFAIIFCFGAIIGSFLNVVGLRLLREESFVLPNSYCYHCKAKIKPYDNIPILSWLILGGKCRECKGIIHWQYPLVELFTASMFVAVTWQYGFSLQACFLLFLVCNFVVVLITDFREQYIFDVNSIGIIPFGLIYAWMNLGHMPGTYTLPWLQWTVPYSFMTSIVAVAGAFFIFGVLNIISLLVIGKRGFGEGDTRLLMGVGSFFGVKYMVAVFVCSFILQAAIGIPILIKHWIDHKAYLTAGLMVAALLLAGMPYILQPILPDGNTILLTAMVCGVVAMICAMKALKLAKNLSTGFLYLPFGPAIVFACIGMLFYSQPVLNALHQILHI